MLVGAASALSIAAACVGNDDATTGVIGTDSGGGGESGTGPGTDATTTADTSTPTDGAVDTDSAPAPACNLTKPFQTPSRVDDVFTAIADEDDGARLSPDGLELFLARKLSGTTTRIVHQYRRTSLTAPWTNDTTIAQLSKTATNANTTADLMTLTPSGTTAFFQFYYSGPPSDNKGIFMTARTGLNAVDWTAPATISGMGSDQGLGDEAPFLTADGKHLYFFSKRADGTNFHAMHADVAGTTVSAIDRVHVQFPNAMNPPNEFATIVTPDERTLYFASYTAGIDSGVLQRYLYKATRATTASDFTQAEIVPELYVESAFTSPTWVSADGCAILFISNRAPGGYHVWAATKPKT